MTLHTLNRFKHPTFTTLPNRNLVDRILISSRRHLACSPGPGCPPTAIGRTREVEEVLYGHPAVGEAAVIGVPHAEYGEEVKAVVAFKPGKSATVEELVAYCKDHVAAYKYPRIVEIRDALPKGPTGKILKRELRG